MSLTAAPPSDTILIVDDEEPVRKTFLEWLTHADFNCDLLTAADAESALKLANQRSIDLVILDWNLGAGNHGLQLLEDLYLFHPDVVAIMVTGFAHQATPLDALRMGVRDYLDKNQDLDRESFLRAVRRQLDRIRPAKRERQFHQGLQAFREAVEKVLPLVQSAATLNDPLPLPDALRGLLRFLTATVRARDGVVLVRSYDADRQPAETCRVYDADGRLLDEPRVPFARSIAGTAVSLQEPCMMNGLEETAGSLELQAFERGRRSLIAAPLAVAPGIHVILELFDKEDGAFTEADRKLVATAADLGVEMLRQALAERQTRRILFDAVETALAAGDTVAQTLQGSAAERLESPPSPAVLERLREGLGGQPGAVMEADDTLRLAESVRVLALRHGPAAVRHCIRLVDSLRELLDALTQSGDPLTPVPRAERGRGAG
jgi:two-component system nitrogen regulation response regulator NtrX